MGPRLMRRPESPGVSVPQPVDLTAMIVTYNEARNLPACLASVAGWVRAIVVVDSGSTDETVVIARRAGATVVPHPFESHPAQWNWALRTVTVQTPWVLAIDADQRVTPALRDRLAETLPMAPPDLAGYYVERRLVFRGRWLRWGGCTRWMLKVFRTGQARSDEAEAPDHRFYVAGKTGTLRAPLLEENQNEQDLAVWLAKQRQRAQRQAELEWRWRAGDPPPWLIRPTWRGSPDQRILWWKSRWYRMPRYLRPVLYFLYRYLLLGGWLDGWPGLLFHGVQGFWLRWLVDVELGRLRRASAA